MHRELKGKKKGHRTKNCAPGGGSKRKVRGGGGRGGILQFNF